MIGPKAEKQPKQIPDARRAEVEQRSGGLCESCGVAPAQNIHHRQYLKRGGTHDLHNLIHLCGLGNTSGCHGRAHNAGEGSGLSVWSWARPEWWPVVYRGRWVLLLDEPDQRGRWWSVITESTATLLMQGGQK